MKARMLLLLGILGLVLMGGCSESDPAVDLSGNTDNPGGNEQPALKSVQFTVDAAAADKWAYFSFAKGETVTIADAKTSKDWDIAFQKTKVLLNGGVSGPGQGSMVALETTDFSKLAEAPESDYVADAEGAPAFAPESDKGWYHYTGDPNHWILPMEKVFVLKTADGKYAKLRFVGYYKDNEKKDVGGFVTIEYAYQPDGSRKF